MTAEDRLIEEHMWLVRSIAHSMRVPREIDRDDLISAGHVALILCARRFDSAGKVPFRAYAKRRIEGAMQDHLRKMDWCPRRARTTIHQFVEAQQELGFNTSHDIIANMIGISTEQIHAAMSASNRAELRSLDAPVSDENSLTLHSVLPDTFSVEDTILLDELKAEVLSLLDTLPPRHRLVIQRFFFENIRMVRIGEELCVSESRISQMKTEALDMLRDELQARALQSA